MIQEIKDYRKILKAELASRLGANPAYSLRAFARDLGLSPAQMSLVLNGQKGLSPEKAAEIGETLGWSENENQYFRSLVASEHGRSRASKQVAKEHLKKYDHVDPRSIELQLDLFKVVGDWYHFAILESLKLKKGSRTTKALAKKLSLNEIEIDLALERLARMGLVEKKGASYSVLQDTVLSTENVPSDAIRKFHTQVIDKSKTALSQQSVKERYYRTQFLPVRKSDLDLAQAEIREFFEKFTQKFSNGVEGDEVYSLGVQYFRLTQTEER